ncbi:response regulator transcription factor [Thalassotalea sp. HSM 43]|uniref:response regulator transcription factor n=1 Tax=Thalassotalea sp. HSM 43 TaxID=2552945 RepID=UPI001081A332|nr:response regulator transcription factor [Thalassotalea sp. HSM 43]QBY04394.1 response regulator transcription factor [Thalassotalea sp. HSM 43]
MRLLLVEDDQQLQQQLAEHLQGAGFSVDVADDGKVGLFQACEYPYDAAIIDVGLPFIDGITLIQTLRKQQINFPILILTARDHWQDRVAGLDAGADDYLAKPFVLEELLARLNALIRRSVGQASPVINNGPLAINTKSQQVSVNQDAVNLSSSEYRLLEYLFLHIGEVSSKAELTEHIYNEDFDLDSNVIEVFIRRLRKKLDPDNQYGFIETMRGQGYKLVNLDTNDSKGSNG